MRRLVFSETPPNRDPKCKFKGCGSWRNVSLNLEEEPSANNYEPCIWEHGSVVVAFNLPRISACLERLMGTNVVRLTDRKYMKELRDRIEEDHRMQLLKRIRARELKEVERERLLIIDGKSDVIPDELADDPIFVVNKTANKEIQKQRSKLKTNRERNSERLKVQGMKWERERLQHEEEERAHLIEAAERQMEQRHLEESYKQEDAERGMDLLRIDNEDWRTCELKLKEFLEEERAKMKARSLKVSTPFSSDKQDILNIVRARQRFREAELRIRQELDNRLKDFKSYPAMKELMTKTATSKQLASDIVKYEFFETEAAVPEMRDVSLSRNNIYAEKEDDVVKYSDEASSLTTEAELVEYGSTISESRRRHALELNAVMESEVDKGLLISKEQYDHLRFEEAKIIQLRHAKDIKQLYELAEEIIIGERIEEEIVEEEMGEEEELPPPTDEDDEEAPPAETADK